MIGDRAFERCTSLTEVIIGDSVTSIRLEAFRDCTSLTSVYFEGDAPSFGDRAFRNCPAAIVYYRAEATNRRWTLSGRPTSLWIPLTVKRVGEKLEMTWTPGVIQSADEIGGTWSDVEDAKSPYLVDPVGEKKFFRVKLP